jgi:hypothetical protein
VPSRLLGEYEEGIIWCREIFGRKFQLDKRGRLVGVFEEVTQSIL